MKKVKTFKERKKEFTNQVLKVIGCDRPYTKQEIAELTGLNERTIRCQLHDIAIYYGVISYSSKKGYRLANTRLEEEKDILAEIEELNHSINEDKKRASEIKARMNRKIACKKVLEKKLKVGVSDE